MVLHVSRNFYLTLILCFKIVRLKIKELKITHYLEEDNNFDLPPLQFGKISGFNMKNFSHIRSFDGSDPKARISQMMKILIPTMGGMGLSESTQKIVVGCLLLGPPAKT